MLRVSRGGPQPLNISGEPQHLRKASVDHPLLPPAKPLNFSVVNTLVVPAHNESGVIGRLLSHLVSDARPGEFDIIVVANGCTDNTVEVAASFEAPVRVLSIPVPSKREALLAGDHAATSFPRFYVDADVELGTEDIRLLATALQQPGVLAVAPERQLALARRPRLVRWYYDVWARLPEVRGGLFGRGVIGVSQAGHERIANLPLLQGDDLAASLSFAPHERAVVAGARVVIHTPRTFADLLRRRVRAATGTSQLERTEGAPASTARTRPSDVVAIAWREPRMALPVALFMAVAVLARLRASRAVARGDYSTWLRDESSRQSAGA
ncbi:MAG TPA: glycosyltransferase [Streptosporangiaceae bacterium]|nr:glycosyltransferase [Streptosporangiaceae bacterium]